MVYPAGHIYNDPERIYHDLQPILLRFPLAKGTHICSASREGKTMISIGSGSKHIHVTYFYSGFFNFGTVTYTTILNQEKLYEGMQMFLNA
jgi:hypothetical protein